MRYVLSDMQTGTQDIRLPVQAISPYTGEREDLATASHGRTVFTYICPKTGKEFDVLGTIKDLPKAKVTSDRFDTGRSFCTKLWNAARFTLMNLGKYDYRPVKREQLEAEDLWILSRLSKTIAAVTRHLEQYNPSAAIGTARDFFWSELCDWYLELIKPRLKDDKYACTARTVLSFAFDMVLRLFHPFVPFITEALWEKLNEQAPVRGLESELPGSRVLVAAQWPVGPKQYEDKARERDFTLIQQVIRLIRNLKARHNVSPTREVDVLIKARGAVGQCIVDLGHLIRNMAFVGRLEVGEDIKRPASSAVQVEGETEVYVVGLLDPEKEKAKLENQKTLLQRNLVIVEKKLSNPNFLKKAPPQVVEQERKKLGEL